MWGTGNQINDEMVATKLGKLTNTALTDDHRPQHLAQPKPQKQVS